MSETAVVRLRESALAAEKRGATAQAREWFEQARLLAPADAALANSFGGFLLRNGDAPAAVEAYRRAAALAPDNAEFAINFGIALGRAGRLGAALGVFARAERIAEGDARYWSARAASEREAGDLGAAAASYERSLALAPRHARALHGSARVALERGASDAARRFERALASSPSDPQLWLGHAQALNASGDVVGAIAIVRSILQQLPGWTDALSLLAQLRIANGEGAAFAGHFAEAHAAFPEDRAIVRAWCAALAGADLFAEAADVAAAARRRAPGDVGLATLEASHAGEAGDLARAGAIFAAFTAEDDEFRVEHARHLLRARDPQAAEALLADVIGRQPGGVVAWALRGLCWRLLGDPRHAWLHEQPGLVSVQRLDIDQAALAGAVCVLHRLHDASAQLLGQSVRGGTQTRGALFARAEPELAVLRAALERGIETYRQALPAADRAHPVLRHRDAAWRITGSWSVRLGPLGRHTVHVHPLGIVSSALYLELPPPDAGDPEAGWLELGGAPPGLLPELAPLLSIEPRAGCFALFPSTLFHGVRPFASGVRLTAAFDVAPVE